MRLTANEENLQALGLKLTTVEGIAQEPETGIDQQVRFSSKYLSHYFSEYCAHFTLDCHERVAILFALD